MNFTSISVEGGILPPDLLENIAIGGGELPGQKPMDFNVSRGRSLSDVMQRSFADARDYWNAFQARRDRSGESPTTLTRQYWMEGFLELLEFPRPRFQRNALEVGDRSLVISHRMHEGEFAPPINIVAWNQSLDEKERQHRHTPHAAVQSYLNGSETLWGVATNGGELRLLRDSVRFSKPSYLEFNLQAMLEGNLYNEFAVLYRLLHATRFPAPHDLPHDCWLEKYHSAGVERGDRVRDRLRDGVKGALETLGTAFLRHPANAALAESIGQAHLTDTHFYRQLLRLVYRLLFLMVTEERKLLAQEAGTGMHSVYSRYYSVGRLRTRAERHFAGDRHTDLWEGLKKTFRLFRDDTALDLHLSPLNGELFGPEACQDLESATCSNADLLKAMQHLSTFDVDSVRRRVNYAHLDVEELGSVYESLLDYRPEFTGRDEAGVSWGFALAAGTERKQTGSYYTPPELVRELIGSALAPVMEERLREAGRDVGRREKALLSLRVCDPACGSGHFLLAATRCIARELARTRTGQEEPALPQYREAVRDVVRHCIYGVDKNLLAVDLCKVALWIESHAAGYPLGFLDHRIKCGDSLVGVYDLECLAEGIPDGAYKEVKGDDKKTASLYRKLNRQGRQGQPAFDFDGDEEPADAFAAEMAAVGMQDERNPADVRAKQELYTELRASDYYDRLRDACDLWTYAFFAPLVASDERSTPIPTSSEVYSVLKGLQSRTRLKAVAKSTSETLAFFHWPLEFPEVFAGPERGFDVVLANPPWERVKLEEKEFFASRAPAIADAPHKAARQLLIDKLKITHPRLAVEFAAAARVADATSLFIRQSRRTPLTGKYIINTYSVFAETAQTLLNPTGRTGLIVPTGIAMDNANKEFFASLTEGRRLASLLDFENHERVFPGIHRSLKFSLLTISGIERLCPEAEFAFFLHNTQQIGEQGRRVRLTAVDFRLFNPNTRNCPMFRTPRDMEIARKMYQRAGVLWNENLEDTKANPWGIQLKAMFNMSNDSNLFRTREEMEQAGWRLQRNEFVKGLERHLPLYEAKLFEQFDHRFATFADVVQQDKKKGKARAMNSREKEDPNLAAVPRYWVHEEIFRAKFDKTGLSLNESDLPIENSREPRAASREPRAASREPRAASREPRAASREPRAASREPRAASREPRAAVKALASIVHSWLAGKSPIQRTREQ